jgi:hypothetical protein
VNFLYILLRGSGNEVNSNKQSIKRWRRNILSIQNIIYQDQAYTSFVAEEDCVLI